MQLEIDLDHIERVALQRQQAGGRVAVRPAVLLALVGRIRTLENQAGTQTLPGRSANARPRGNENDAT